MIDFRDISHRYWSDGENDYVALANISFGVEAGTFVSFLGPSGCGKTTLLRIANGLIQPTEGEVWIAGHRVEGPAADRAMVFQEFNLLPWRTAQANVELPLQILGKDRRERARVAAAALADVGLAQFKEFYPHQLSGGMKQRVGLARALSIAPSYLFMDEPFGALDPQIREVMQVELMKLWDKDRKTVLFVTHSVDEAIYLSDRVIMFSGRPGRVIVDLKVELPRPRWSDADAIKASAAFIDLRMHVWSLLKQQIEPMA